MKLFNRTGGGTPEYLIAGLGNPGREYENSRHNTGFRTLDYISGATGTSVTRLKHYSLTGKCVISGKSVLLVKPQTYMNESGNAISDASRYYRIPPERVIVIYDDVSLPVGALRIRKTGSAGGHNGIKSIISYLGTQDFIHIRLGIGEKPEGYDLADYVLGKLSPNDYGEISANFDSVFKAIELIISGDTDRAMSLYNRNGSTGSNG